ncbi:MAG TPA: helicase-related protein, partial [Minicystis sp.]|nr:helicase-related protein [Minicystis sp.]
MPDGSSITAILGPTNTGKTHRAIERMLEHESGIIGLPLRLLAREVYDRVTARVGERRVALVTGEEKRVPRGAAYFVCTVEAMPVEREVDFVAVDEVQLAAHPQRGHVFTDRLLRARGRKETFFLGSETVRGVLAELVPTARIATHPRLSRLASAGAAKLSRVPPRSAVVAFSMAEVVELGERLRALRGGAAVVLGALSPRTRNAQVAMFEAGEVDYLVATDAIGMGLNLDVKHVAFASLRKFDGREARALEPAELGQIAGRAGRHLADGTFGTILPVSLGPDVVARLEAHRFDPVRRVRYRSADLDFASVEALIGSLRAPPRRSCLRLDLAGEDLAALAHLARDPEVRARARGPDGVRVLWDVCRVPDFRKLLFESHAALLREIFLALAGTGSLDDARVAEAVAAIDDVEGDLSTLLDRIASIRTWTYVANQGAWVNDAAAWQARTRAVEDRLSDALHDRLVQRFVEKQGTGARARGPARRALPRTAPDQGFAPGPPVDKDHPFARLASMRLPAAGPRAAAAGDARLAEAIVTAPHEAFDVDARGAIMWRPAAGGAPERVGRLVRGASLLLPDVRVETALEL